MSDERARAPASEAAPGACDVLTIAVDPSGDGMRERSAARKTSDE